jgi:cytoskeletal protein CcmA (bactofilin family)
MKLFLKVSSLFLLAALVFLPARVASASASVFDGQVIFGQSFTLAAGDTMAGDLLVFGGTAEIQAGASVQGNIVLFGGELTVDGEATGDVAAIGATVTLGPSAHIGGDLVTVGATLEQAETAQVDGQIYNTATSWSEASNGDQPVEPIIPEPEVTIPKYTFNLNPFQYFWDVVSNAIFLGLLAMLLMLFLARQAENVAQAAVKQTLTAGGLGLLTVIVAPFAIVLLAITIVLIPVAVLVALALGVAVLFGWIAFGYEVGRRLTAAFHWQWHPALSAGLGTFLLSLVVNSARVLNFVPGMQCFSWILPALVGLFSLGAVIMTRFGTQAGQVASRTSVSAVVPVEALPPTAEILPAVPPEEPRHRKKNQ